MNKNQTYTSYSVNQPDPAAMRALLDAISEMTARRGEILDARYHASCVQIDRQGYCNPDSLPLSAELETLSEEISECEKAQRLAFAPVELNYSHVGA